MPVDRCVCHRVTFHELAAIARRYGCDLDGLAERTGCTTGCGMCKPYVQLMLESGRTSFEPLPQPQERLTKGF